MQTAAPHPRRFDELEAYRGSDRATILSAEDDCDMAELLRLTLECAGYRVITARTGAAAIDSAQCDEPDLFLLDLNMPVLSGIEATRRLRTDPRFHATPVVLLSANVCQERKDEAMAAGVTRYVTKPLPPKTLVTIVDEMLGQSR